MPIFAGVASAAVLLAGFGVAWPYLMRRPPRAPEAVSEDILSRLEAGQRALARGRFRQARDQLNAALVLRDRHPRLLEPGEHRRLNQLQRQADLLARLLTVPLEELVRQARLVADPEEWALQLADHRGRGVVFDDAVRRDGLGRPVLIHHVIEVGDVTVRLALEDLTLLQDLPLDDAPRLLFGARLSDCSREDGGAWVLRFEPDSGVLFTDAEAVAAVASVSLEPGLAQTLLRQQRWLDERAVVPPSRP
jgi:hypothetical protein